MRPILFEKNETDFTSNGLGRINCLRFDVEEARNGLFEVEMEVDIDDPLYPEITEDRIVFSIHDDTKIPQPFDIYGRSEPIDGVVTFYGKHVSYRLGKNVCMPFSEGTCIAALSGINQHTVRDTGFTFWTDIASVHQFSVTMPTSVRAVLGGMEGSILDTFGGEYEWDKWTVKLHGDRGDDKGVTIRHGVNLTKFDRDTDNSETYNAVSPYWKGEDAIVTLSDGYVALDGVQDEDIKVVPLDLSEEFDGAPSQEQLKSRAKSVLEGSSALKMKESIDIDFVQLWQTEEYEAVAPLQRVSLCDIVTVVMRGKKYRAKVVNVVYDALNERYKSMTLGEARASFVGALRAQVEDAMALASNAATVSMMQAAINTATALIRGGLGGHVVMKPNADGEPEEILIMDTDNVNTAVKVWRWNLGGLGFSSSGVDGPYTTAITQNGQIVADFITTGTLIASLIKTGLLQGTSGGSYFNLDTGVIGALRGIIGPFTISEAGLTYGSTTPMGEGASINKTGITYTTKETISVPGLPEMAFRAVIDGTGLFVSMAGSASDSWSKIFSMAVSTDSGSVEINADGSLLINGRIPATIHKYNTDVLDYVLKRTFTVDVSSADGWELIGLRSTTGMNLLADENIKSVYYSGTTLTITKTSETAYQNHTCVAIFAKAI